MTTARILVVTDRTPDDPARGKPGPSVAQALAEGGIQADVVVIGQGPDEIRTALDDAVAAADIVVTCGGTALRGGEGVIDATGALGLIELPGIAEEIRRRGAANTPASLLSRGVCGVTQAGGRPTVVLNAPSSTGGARQAVDVLLSVWPFLVRDLGLAH